MTSCAALALLLLSCVVSSCGNSSAEETTAEPADPKRAILNNIATLGTDVFNANWVGKTCTTVSKKTTCPGGGDITITGQFSCSTSSTGVTTSNIDFKYEMTDCVEVANSLTLTLTGTMTHSGSSTSVSSIITSETMAYKSVSSVKIKGSGKIYKSFDSSCDFSISSKVTEAGSASKTSGTLCGDSFSMTP